jgi:transcriptional repressor NrdR
VDALSELQQSRYAGEGFAADRGFGRDPAAAGVRRLRELTVIKRNGRRVPFDRDKLMRSVQISLRKRPVDPERVEKMVSAIVRELESGGEAEVSSEAIGEIVMEHLRQLDDVAYVRFASVYRDFREAKDFEAVLGELSGEDEARVATLRK